MRIIIFKVHFQKYISLQIAIRKVWNVINGIIQDFKYENNCQAGFPFSAGNGRRKITALLEELRQQ